MAHFYGRVEGNRGAATRLGTKDSGIGTVAASWDGCILTNIWYDATKKVNRYEVWQGTWHGAGVSRLLSGGIVGE
jgi:hypothetical protein